MSINLGVPPITELKPRILVMGVGGAGGNAVNNMIHSNLEGVDFVVANTDSQALTQSQAERRIQLGATVTQGLGAGTDPDVGRAAAEEAADQIHEHLDNAHMVFLTAGLGGGTGTGATPVIARIAQEMGILTVAVVTKPFQFEGRQRTSRADSGLDELRQYVDTLIVIPNQNLFRVANEQTTFAEAFAMADKVLMSGVRGITDLMVMPGLINLDFADVRAVMQEMGSAMMGTGEAEGEGRAVQAAELAISNPLLDDMPIRGAKGVIVNITGGPDLTLFDVDAASNMIRGEVDEDANIIIGSTFDDGLEGKMRVSVFASGIDADDMIVRRPSTVTPLRRPERERAKPEIEQREPALEVVASRPLDAEAPEPEDIAAHGPADDEGEAEAPTADAGAGSEPSAPESGTESEPPARRALFGRWGPSPVLRREVEEDPVAPDNDDAAVDRARHDEDPAEDDAGPEQPEIQPDAQRDHEAESESEPPFIAPPAMQPDGRMSDKDAVDPFAEAAMSNGCSADEPDGPEAEQPEPAASAETPAATETGGGRSQVDLEEAIENSPMFGGVGKKDRVTRDDEPDEELEIPAFLRRQAN